MFVFIVFLKHIFLGTTKFERSMLPVATGLREPWWSYQRNCQKRWTAVSTLSTLLKQVPWIRELFRCYAEALLWELNVNHCCFKRLCVGFTGQSSARLFEPCHEISQFVLSQNNHHLYEHLEHGRWIAKPAYMNDLFQHLNEVNIKMPSKN